MDSAFDIADTVSKLNTNDQARAGLGIISTMLNDGYRQVPDVSADQDLRAATLSLLDSVNAYAQKIYSEIPDDTGPLGIGDGARLGLVASQTNDALAQVERNVGVSEWHVAAALQAAVKDVATSVGNVAGTAVSAPFTGLIAGVVAFAHSAQIALLIGGGIVAVYLFRKPILSALSKVGA
jgi:hypothetical protein